MAGTGAPMTKSGFCAWPSPGSHTYCNERGLKCDCPCHADPAAFDDGTRIGDRAAGDDAMDVPSGST